MNTKQIARETVEALERGSYQVPDGMRVDISAQLDRCVMGTQYYEPQQLDRIRQQILAQTPIMERTEFEVINETTLQGSRRLKEVQHVQHVVALNFASARNPGGGFLGGAQAQEESLARSSGLYKSLLECPDYYAFHRAQKTCLYSDRMIYSPDCPIFRTDGGGWLAQPYAVDFLTSPAPNAGAIARNEPQNIVRIAPVLRERASKVLALAAHHGGEVLVLGAWGCGAFRNDPQLVAGILFEQLGPLGPFWGRFHKVVFSVLDKSTQGATFGAFASRFLAVA